MGRVLVLSSGCATIWISPARNRLTCFDIDTQGWPENMTAILVSMQAPCMWHMLMASRLQVAHVLMYQVIALDTCRCGQCTR